MKEIVSEYGKAALALVSVMGIISLVSLLMIGDDSMFGEYLTKLLEAYR